MLIIVKVKVLDLPLNKGLKIEFREPDWSTLNPSFRLTIDSNSIVSEASFWSSKTGSIGVYFLQDKKRGFDYSFFFESVGEALEHLDKILKSHNL